jgi:peptide/nickel transport system substrate-binding protein
MRRIPAIAAVGAMAMLLAACGSSGGGQATSGGQKLASGKTFTLVLPSDPGALDPDFTSLSAALQLDNFMYDSLVNLDQKGDLEAGLASKWSGGTTSATFTLRKGVTCSDGTKLTASDVAANINFVANPKNASNWLGVFVQPGAQATADSTTGTVTVASQLPDPFLVQDLGSLPIVCPKGAANRSMLKEGGDGTGMFTMSQVIPGSQYTFTRRKDYAWGPGNWNASQPGLPDKVVVKVVSDMTTAANLLLAGQVNAATVIGPDAQRVQAKHLFQQSLVAPLGELWYNQKAGQPGADQAVRTALTEALNLTQLGQVVTSGAGTPPAGLVEPGHSPCRQNTVKGNLPAYNLAAAKSALTGAGWTAGAGGILTKGGQKLSLNLYYAPSLGAGMQAGAELLQKAWSSLGAQVTLTAATQADFNQILFSGATPWSAAIVPLGVPLPTNLVGFLSGPTPPKGTNFASINNATYSADVKAASSIAGAGGCAKWDAAEVAIFHQVDLVPFVDSTVQVFGTGATFQISNGDLVASSIRMLG